MTEIEFKKIWQSLPDDKKDEIRAKASWEKMTLSGVIKNYYPELLENKPSITKLTSHGTYFALSKDTNITKTLGMKP